MVGLKDEPHMVAPELGQLLGPGVYRGAAAHANRSPRGRQNASENRQQRGLAAPGRPHQQRQFTALERQAHALESFDLSRSIADQFHDIDGLDDGVGHHVNTIPGSMRVTCTADLSRGASCGKTVEKIEGLLGAGAASLVYAGYPYDPYA